MPGFEILGVVLGVIPLVISALEQYSDGVSTVKHIVAYERVFMDIQSSFAASVAIYIDSCYMLLSPLNLPDNQLKELLDERNQEAWRDEKLCLGLTKRLGPNSAVYVSLVKKLNKRIVLFCRKLKLDENLRTPWTASDGTFDDQLRKKFFNNIWTRIKGGFDSDKYAALLADIDQDINRISQLTSGAITLEPIRRNRNRKLNAQYWRSIRDQVQRVFGSLNSQLFPCSCQLSHRADLRLDVWNEEEDFTRCSFLFTFNRNGRDSAIWPWIWRNVEIETSEAQSLHLESLEHKKAIRFVNAPLVIVNATNSAANAPQTISTSIQKIENLCETLLQRPISKCCLGFLEDRTWKHHVYSMPETNRAIQQSTNLQEVLYGENRASLGPREKCTIALALALGVLRLHETEWLRKDWHVKDIYLTKDSQGTLIVDRPYVSRTFGAINDTQSSSIKRRRGVKNDAVFSLGVALLELSWGDSILNLKTHEDLNDQGVEDSMLEFCIATRLADSIHLRELPNYARAVVRCIRCNFDAFTCDFEDRDFRDGFYEGVVVPLREDYGYATRTYSV